MRPERRRRRKPSGFWTQVSRWRAAFRRWRRTRPFWAGVITILGAVELISIPLAPMELIVRQGVAGVASWLMGSFMILMAMVMWFQPHLRTIAGISTILFALASFPTSNFGGFLIGMLLGIVGGSMAFAWDVDETVAPAPAQADGAAEPDMSPTAAERQETARAPVTYDDASLTDDLVGREAEGRGG